MKSFKVIVCLIVLLAQHFVNVPALGIGTFEAHHSTIIMSKPCGARDDGAGTGEFKVLTCTACNSNYNCSAKAGKYISGILVFVPSTSETELMINISASARSPDSIPLTHQLTYSTINEQFKSKEEIYQPYGFTFHEAQYVNNSGAYDVQIKLYSTRDSDTVIHICRTFTIYLNTTYIPSNNVKIYQGSCTQPNEPCALLNSLCLLKGNSFACQCDSTSYYEVSTKGCRKKIGVPCQLKKECISNAYCPWVPLHSEYGYCNCSNGFENDPDDLTKCISGSSITLASFALVNILLAFCNQMAHVLYWFSTA